MNDLNFSNMLTDIPIEQIAKTLIRTVFQVSEQQILNFKEAYVGRLSYGYSFNVFCRGKVCYFLRINLGKTQKQWKNEYNYLKISGLFKNYVYYDINTGNYIKVKIPGEHPKSETINLGFYRRFLTEMVNFHQQKIIDRASISYTPFLQFLEITNLKKEDQKLFLKIANWNGRLPIVLSHNALCYKNILDDTKNITFLDFEWVGWNNAYADLAYFIWYEELDLAFAKKLLEMYNRIANQKLTWSIMEKILFFTACHAYQWTFSVKKKDEKKVKSYRQKAFRAMQFYKEIFNLNSDKLE